MEGRRVALAVCDLPGVFSFKARSVQRPRPRSRQFGSILSCAGAQPSPWLSGFRSRWRSRYRQALAVDGFLFQVGNSVSQLLKFIAQGLHCLLMRCSQCRQDAIVDFLELASDSMMSFPLFLEDSFFDYLFLGLILDSVLQGIGGWIVVNGHMGFWVHDSLTLMRSVTLRSVYGSTIIYASSVNSV